MTFVSSIDSSGYFFGQEAIGRATWYSAFVNFPIASWKDVLVDALRRVMGNVRVGSVVKNATVRTKVIEDKVDEVVKGLSVQAVDNGRAVSFMRLG